MSRSTSFVVGSTLILTGLKSLSMNGKTVVVMVPLDATTGRVKVRLPSAKVVAVKEENLVSAGAEELPPRPPTAPAATTFTSAAAATPLPIGDRELDAVDFRMLMKRLLRDFTAMFPQFESRCRVEGPKLAAQWVEVRADAIQHAAYETYGISQAGFAHYAKKFEGPEFHSISMQILRVRKNVENLRIAMSTPSWLMDLQVEQMDMKSEPLHTWPRERSNAADMASFLAKYQRHFLRLIGDTVEAVRVERKCGSADELLGGREGQLRCLEMFLPNWNTLKKAMIFEVDSSCDQRDLEIAFQQWCPQQWKQMQLIVHQQLTVRFSKAMQYISDLLAGKDV